MKKVSFQQRLERVRRKGNLTVADLSVWFDRPYGTIRSWLYGRSDRQRWESAWAAKNTGREGYEPWGLYRDQVYRQLELLERLLRQKGLSADLSQRERLETIKAWRREHHRALSKTRSAA